MFGILRKPFPNDFIAGLFYMAAAFVPHFIRPRAYGLVGSLIFGALYYLGAIFLANYTIQKLSGKAMLHDILATRRKKLSFIKYGLIGAVPFSLAVCDFGGLWYFPHWSIYTYYIFGYLCLGWVFYFLTLTLCYTAFKLIFDRIIPPRRTITKYYVYERKWYRALGVVGGWLAIMVITVGLQNARWLTHFSFVINRPKPPFLYWYWWLIALLGWVMLCEYVSYRRKRTSLLKDTLHGYITPLLAVITCGVVLGVTNEYQNLPINLWHYANYPWGGEHILSVPLFIVFAWPFHIIAFVEFWRAFGDEKSTDILFQIPKQKRP